MAVPFSSAYQPINDLNASIMAQQQAAQQGFLAKTGLDNQQAANAINAIVAQKKIAADNATLQQHYALQRQQLENDMATRNQQFGLNRDQFGLNKALTEAQIKAMEYQTTHPKLDPSAIPALIQRDEFNTAATGISGGVNIALKTAKGKRDAMIKEIEEAQKTNNPLNWDFWRDVWHTDADWAKQVRAIDAGYRDEVARIAQAAQGKVTIQNTSPDDYEAIAVTLPQLNFPGMPPQPQPRFDGFEAPTVPSTPQGAPDNSTGESPLGPFPASFSRPVKRGSYATFNPPINASPFANFGRTNAPPAVVTAPVQPAQVPFNPNFQNPQGTNAAPVVAPMRRFRYNMDGTLTPIQ